MIYWLVAGGILVVTEIFVGSFVLLWFGIGAFAAALMAYMQLPLWVQCAVFAVISIALYVLFRKTPYILGEPSDAKFCSDRLIGRTGIVTKAIVPGAYGQIKIDGELWTAVSQENFSENETVVVEKIDGAKAVVKSS